MVEEDKAEMVTIELTEEGIEKLQFDEPPPGPAKPEEKERPA